MFQSIMELALELTQAGKPFILATVVRCDRPTSAKPGAQALIQENGKLTGWIGGSCVQPIVLREARRILRDGDDPFLLRLGSDEMGEMRGIRQFPMTCASGGTLDVYIEPHLPQPHLLLIGDSPVIHVLTQLAPVLDFVVTVQDDGNLSQMQIDERTFVLVATHGQYDEIALEKVLPSSAAYIGLVSSPRRAEACRVYLREAGLAEKDIARLKAPAGLDIGAVAPTEIAASIIAELIQLRHRLAGKTDAALQKNAKSVLPVEVQEPVQSEDQVLTGEAIDLVCHMTVEIATARHKSTYDGREFYFCCLACKRQFDRNPEQFLEAEGQNSIVVEANR